MNTKYKTTWKSADGRKFILEDMNTDHLLNVYAHTLNNYPFYLGMFTVICNGDQHKAKQEVTNMRDDIKQELLSRGLSHLQIETHKEDASYIKKV